MTFGSRGKGKTGEREVAKLLAPWWGALEPGCQFVSTPLSGGFSTAHVRGGFHMSGDLMTTATRWPFCVEVKRREGWSDGPLLQGRPSPVWDWWRQCQRAAAEEQRVPMLWFRRNREDWRVLLPRAWVVGATTTDPPAWDDAWATGVLNGVQYGAAVPVLYQATTLLQSRPERWLPPVARTANRFAV